MLTMSVTDLVRATGATVLSEGAPEVKGTVVIDSRAVEPGSVFVAFKGEKVDGNAYLDAALNAGAALVVATAEPAPSTLELARARKATVLRAANDDGIAWMLAAARAWREAHPEWVVLGVTGSVGKTTTKEMLAAGVASQRRCFRTQGNLNSLYGLPMTLFSVPEGTEVVVAEMGMDHPHEIDRMSEAAAPVMAVVTNVGTSHIGALGSRENIACAKAEIVSGMRAHEGVEPALFQLKDGDFTPLISDAADKAGVESVLVGGRDGFPRAEGVAMDGEGRAHFTLACADGWSRQVALGVPGAKVVDDFLLAFAVIERLGLDRNTAVDAIEQMRATSMRLDVRTTASGARVIDDSYNAAPASMASSLDVLAAMSATGRKIAVLGEIAQLGDDDRRLHGYVGAYAAAKGVDLLVLIGGTLADEMAEAARTMGLSEDAIERFATVEDAVRVMGSVLTKGDVVLVKASRAAGLDAFVEGVLA